MGYCGAELGRKWNKNLQESAEKYGLLRKTTKDYRPKVNSILVFAMKNKTGQIIDIYGRSIRSNPRQKHFYLQGTQQGLYPHYPKSNTSKLILTESIIDAASLVQIDEINENYAVIALYGINGFTEEHKTVIKSLEQLKEITLFFDGDEAGEKGVKKVVKQLEQLRPAIKTSYVNTPKGEDANSLLQSHQVEIFTHLLENRRTYSDNQTNLFSIEKKNKEDVPQPTTYELITDNPELLIYKSQILVIYILGGIQVTGLDRMKVTLKIENKSENTLALPIRFSLDLYHSKQVDQLTDKLIDQMEYSHRQTSQLISDLTSSLEAYRHERMEKLKPKKPETYQLTPSEKSTALKYLKHKNLMRNTLRDIMATGIVGEQTNALVGYIVYLSRKREKPLHVMYLGASGIGKTHVQEKLAEIIPAEEKEEATSLSDQALFYEGNKLKGKVLFIEDLDGAENVLYMIRELQSKGRICKKVAWRDNRGNTKTIDIVAEGPVCISSCTTKEKVYEDNANRCILLYIDESADQDKRVMQYQKSKSAGHIKSRTETGAKQKLQNVQRLLKPIKVVNPYAEKIELPKSVFKPRRSLPLLLSFIETVTFYHQYQRKINTDEYGEKYIESTPEDIKIAFALLKGVLFTKSDEISQASRNFLELLKDIVPDGQAFYSKEIRKQLRLNASNLKRYLIELQRYGYIKIKGGNRYRGYEYRITDYKEYEELKSIIDQKLEQTLIKINGPAASGSGPVDQSGSVAKMDYSTNGLSVR